MSKNITIQEGGVAKQLTVDKLKTNSVGVGTCLWVPEDETNLGTKHISENGTYRASDDGYYGYSEVTVSGVGSVTGRDPTTGEDVEVHRDPTTGEIVETVIPSEIRVIEPPTNPYGVYMDGQTITKDGMVVKAYGANGDEMQTVPVGEITINPTVAVYDASKDPGGRRGTATLDGVSIDYAAGAIHCDYPAVVRNFDYCVRIANTVHRYFKRENAPINIIYTSSGNTQNYPVSNGGQTPGGIQYYTATIDLGRSTLPIIQSMSSSDAAEILYDGTHEEEPAGSPQTITASWPRTGDGRVLTNTFEIRVAPGYGGDEGDNGNAGTPTPGMLIP